MKKLILTALALYSTATISSAALAGYWNFDDGTANDSSGNGNHGTFQNGASASANVPAGGGSMSLAVGGGTQHVLVPDNSSLDIGGAITITAWVERPGTIRVGDRCRLHVPPQRLYPHLPQK